MPDHRAEQLLDVLGQEPWDVDERLEVLGISHRFTFSGNQSNAKQVWEKTETVEVPVGTTRVMAVVNGWVLGHGELDMSEWSSGKVKYNADDVHYGIGLANVFAKPFLTP